METTGVAINSPSNVEEPFGLILQDETTENSGIYWTYNIPILGENEKKVIMEVQSG